MILPGTLLMPDALLPLFIFEKRYREMLLFSLRTERVICVALKKSGAAKSGGKEDFFRVAGLGLIRACVTNKEGASHLILHGIARVELLNFVQESPFYIAEIRELATENQDQERTRLLSARVVDACMRYKPKEYELVPEIDKRLPELADPEAFTNMVANTYIHDPYRMQAILQENGIAERLSLILKYLEAS
jgi:Lon protease-like protein